VGQGARRYVVEPTCRDEVSGPPQVPFIDSLSTRGRVGYAAARHWCRCHLQQDRLHRLIDNCRCCKRQPKVDPPLRWERWSTTGQPWPEPTTGDGADPGVAWDPIPWGLLEMGPDA
jgi:hypothetical protein